MTSQPRKKNAEAHIDDTIARLRKTLSGDHHANALKHTIVPAVQANTSYDPAQILKALPQFSLEERPGCPADFLITDVIGEGGHAEIKQAVQVALSREVAVKVLKQETTDQLKLRLLLQEAWVTGWLQHPNIVPVHTRGRSEDGRPLIVMKRIEGHSWSDCIHDTGLLNTQRTYDLNWHLDTLLQVCNAMEYAHDRGILHRDIKPENIMIGRFGEVYVLDWGIAVSMDDALKAFIPLAKDVAEPAGTPMYLPPEGVIGAPPDERLDVYLLGATLYEILEKAPPHVGVSINEVLSKALASTPKSFEAHIPAALSDICNKAMSRDPKDRYQSVKAFRLALEFYQEHKNSITLSKESASSLQHLQALIATTQAQPIEQANDKDDRANAQTAAQIASSYAECLFGFRQALKIWPENKDAQRGLVSCLTTKLHYDMNVDNVSAAHALLEDLRHMPEHGLDLHALEAQLETKHKQQRQLKNIVRDFDISIGVKGKIAAMILMVTASCTQIVVLGYLERIGKVTPTYSNLMTGAVRTAVIVAIPIFLFRKSLFANRVNSQVSWSLLTLPIAMIAFRGVVALNKLPILATLSLETIMYGVFALHIAFFTDRRVAIGAIIYVIGAIIMSIYPQNARFILAGTNMLAILTVLYVWAKHDKPTIPTASTNQA